VPADVALVGYDDIPLAPYAAPPLTTMRTDPIGHGREAMQMLWAQLQHGRAGIDGPLHRLRPAELVIRESCGARAAATTTATPGAAATTKAQR
jgi:DNA-binding LacI/PurR family transcriptional regulator